MWRRIEDIVMVLVLMIGRQQGIDDGDACQTFD